MTHQRISRKRRGAGKLAVLGGVVAVAAIAFGAYKVLFNRAGEAAIQLIPADAQYVVTLDTTPSETQLPTFQRIYSALAKEGIASRLDESLTDMFNKSDLGKEIRPFMARSFAFAYMKADQMSAFTALNDSARVLSALEKHAEQVEDNPPTFKLDEVSSYCAVIGDYLVVTGDEASLARIKAVKDHMEESLASLPEYVEARAGLPRDANLMVFASPQGLKELEKSVAQKSFNGAAWLAFGATIRDDGIAFDFRGPMDSKASAALKAMAQIPAVSDKLLNRYPAGAYGLIAYAQPARYWTAIEEEMRKDKAGASSFCSGLSDFERETKLSIQNDVLPAFQGDFSLAVYPGPSGKADDLDMMIMVDDSNGANPAALVDKARAFLIKKAAESNEKLSFVESKVGGATVWEIDPATRSKMLEGMKGASGPKLDSKTIVFAQVGKGVFFASSRALINRTIEASHGANTLATDPAFASMSQKLTDGSQGNILVSLRRILEALRPQMEDSMKGGPVGANDVIELFGGQNTGLVGSMKFDGNVATGSLFLPLNYEVAIHLMGEGMKSVRSGPKVEEFK